MRPPYYSPESAAEWLAENSQAGERWRVIADYDRYFISDQGRVCSFALRRPRIIRAVAAEFGHLSVSLCNESGTKNWLVHTLVLSAFSGERPPGTECRHMDGDPSNNHITNLLWGSHADNNRDRWRHGTMPMGERHVNAKLTAAQVLWIRSLAGRGALVRAAKALGQRYSLVCGAYYGASWTNLPGARRVARGFSRGPITVGGVVGAPFVPPKNKDGERCEK